MNENLISEAVYCFAMSTDEMYEKDLHTAYRYECSLYELLRQMNDDESAEYRKRITYVISCLAS
jgi:hypothetical protein